MAKDEEPSHDEIWDDTALIDTWEEALQEYKYYHSLHARGEKVEEVIRMAEMEENFAHETPDAKLNVESNNTNQSIAEDGEVDAEESLRQYSADVGVGRASGIDNPTPDQLPMPHAVIGTGQDESLKNLMMSWYYAGYYTGFYEGQQKAQQPAADTTEQAHSTR